VKLDGKFKFLRTQETNLANFVADILYTEYHDTDIALINSGGLRSDSIFPEGPITFKQMS
jgi:2',3'-cyclic-nucleotide 2'-phosphodiesterase (5'-nucleotidase family)